MKLHSSVFLYKQWVKCKVLLVVTNPQNEPTVDYLRNRQRCDVVVKKVKQLAAKKIYIFTVFSVTIFPK